MEFNWLFKPLRKPLWKAVPALTTTTTTLLLVLVTSPHSGLASFTTGSLFDRVSTLDGRVHKISTIGAPTLVSGVTRCANLCLNMAGCESFFLLGETSASGGSSTASNNSLVCQMHSQIFISNAGSESSPGSSYWQLTQEGCPTDKGFVFHQAAGLCYRIVNESMTVASALSKCQDLGSHLLDLPTEERWQHVAQVLQDAALNGAGYGWLAIGGTFDGSVWRWSDGTQFTSQKWDAEEPNGLLWGEACTFLMADSGCFWGDVQCQSYSLSGYICEKDVAATQQPTT